MASVSPTSPATQAITRTRSNISRGEPLFPDELVTIVSIYEVVVIIFCLVGYALVVFAMVLNVKLRSNCNYFILSMGLADCLIATVVIPVSQGQLLQTFYYHSVEACEFVGNINFIAITAVALNLCAVTLERFFAIVFPFRYEMYLTSKTALSIIAGIWVYALVVGLLPQMGWSTSRATVDAHGACKRPLEKSYMIFNTVVHFCLPALLIVVTNILIYRIASKQAKRIYRTRMASTVNRSSMSSRKGSTALEMFRINYRAAKRISIIAGAYLVCWLPQMTLLLAGLKIGFTSIPPVAFLVTLPLQYTSSAINPCIFCLLHKEIRLTLIKELKARLPLLRAMPSNSRDVTIREESQLPDETHELVHQRTNSQTATQCVELSSGYSSPTKDNKGVKSQI